MHQGPVDVVDTCGAESSRRLQVSSGEGLFSNSIGCAYSNVDRAGSSASIFDPCHYRLPYPVQVLLDTEGIDAYDQVRGTPMIAGARYTTI